MGIKHRAAKLLRRTANRLDPQPKLTIHMESLDTADFAARVKAAMLRESRNMDLAARL